MGSQQLPEICRDPQLHLSPKTPETGASPSLGKPVPLRALMSEFGSQGHEFDPQCRKLPLPPDPPCPSPALLPAAHPVRAKLAQNRIIILLTWISSSEAPPGGKERKSLCYSTCGRGPAAATPPECWLDAQNLRPHSRPTETKAAFEDDPGSSGCT